MEETLSGHRQRAVELPPVQAAGERQEEDRHLETSAGAGGAPEALRVQPEDRPGLCRAKPCGSACSADHGSHRVCDHSAAGEPLVYDVICVANHHGPFGYGHYTATCRHPIDGRFYHFNDDVVEELVDDRDVLSAKSYVLFLMRQPASEALRIHACCVPRHLTWSPQLRKTCLMGPTGRS
ncbi:unnamed protein product [Prorocentrum cordatum]|uniref:USP domain-containing protein n=1 Tax=Prorocentrum cordatum TaxID=2364126 RepID=A0ABN9UML7_9DINO|nr:unnamed protein product [Polarella glacialis]